MVGAAALSAAVMLGAIARAAPIDYIFTGTGSGTLNGVSFSGGFSVNEIGDTTTVDTSDPTFFRNNASSAVFASGALTAALTGNFNQVILNKDPAFPRIGFGQGQPAPVFFVAEATSNFAFAPYDLASAFPLTSGTPSFATQTYLTSGGDLTFTSISALSFEATTPGAVPEPSTWALLVLGFGALGTGMRGSRRSRPRMTT